METKPLQALPKNKLGKKSIILIIVAIIIGIFCCASFFAFAWFGGYLKSAICNAVTSDSTIYKQVNCGNNSPSANVSNTENSYPLNSAGLSSNSNQDAEDGELSVPTIVDNVSGAVVGIGKYVENSTAQDLEDNLIGTGFLVSDAGLLVTNLHVVETETTTYYILFKGASSALVINNDDIYRDPVNDIALIKIKASDIPEGVKAIPVGDSDSIKIGETVIAIGNPLGTLTGTVTKGIISGMNREVTVSADSYSLTSSRVYQNVIQTDTAINPGNSGGPLINTKGEVIGINFATIEDASNLSFALPINIVKQRITELEQYGKFKIPYLGVEYRSSIVFLNKQMVVGAEALSIVAGSPADKAGLKVGDVIVSFDGKTLGNSQLSALIQSSKIGDKIEVVVIRNGEQQTLTVEIGVN